MSVQSEINRIKSGVAAAYAAAYAKDAPDQTAETIDNLAATIAAISSGAQVASGSTSVNRSTKMTINPGFTPKKICVGGGSNNYMGYGLYNDGTTSGNISSVSGMTINFSSTVSGTVYWLATSE